MGLFFAIISVLGAVVIVPILCVLEYYSGIKMGMYRYFVLKNSWWLKNVFTPETLPVLRVISLLIVAAGIYFAIRTLRRSKFFKTLWELYGIIIFCGNFYVLGTENFMNLKTAPFFGITCIVVAVSYSLGSLL